MDTTIGRGMERSLAAALVAAALMTAGVVAAAPPERPALAPEAPEGPDRRMEMMLTAVDATEAQRQQVEAIRASYAPRMQALMDQRLEIHQAMEEIEDAGFPVDLEEVRTLADEVGALTADSLVLRAEMKQEIAGVFTEEQRDKLQRMASLRGEHPRPPRGPRGPRAPGH